MRERNRLAAILHDELQQNLVAATMHLTSARANGDIEAIRKHLDGGPQVVEQAI